jgi:hypothetical protein
MSAAASSSAVLDDGEDDLLCAAAPSDTRAALDCLFAEAALSLGGFPVVAVHQLYAIIQNPTETDRELETLRLAHSLRVLRLPDFADNFLIMRADDFVQAVRTAAAAEEDALAATALRAAAAALPRCTGLTVSAVELQAALDGGGGGGGGEGSSTARAAAACARLQRMGWLAGVPTPLRAGPDEAPAPANAEVWLWSYPLCGVLMVALRQCRAAVIGVLRKQRFDRAQRQLVERAPAVRTALERTRLDLRCVLRDLIGKRLVSSTAAPGGTILQLTAAGRQSAHHDSKKRRR